MCGRYDNLIAREAYRVLFKTERLPESNFPPRYNVAPTDPVPIVRTDPRDGKRELAMARWGLIPFWMKEKPKVPHINARVETLEKTRMFREAFPKRRCLVPATGFYEWEKQPDGRQPYRFVRRDREPFAFAGLWEFVRLPGADAGTTDDIVSATIVVGPANSLVAPIHDRMPMILAPDAYDRWLDRDTPREVLRAMPGPYDPELMEAYAVSRRVNSVKNDDESCIAPLDESAEADLPLLRNL